MSNRYELNTGLEVAPAGSGKLELRLALFGRKLEATAYELGLLQRFAEPNTPEQVVSAFPFDKQASLQFLQRCIQEGFLLPRDDAGRLVFPDRVLPQVTLLNTPVFDPSDPPAFAFIGAPFDGATTGMPGTRFGPSAMRQMGAGVRYQLDAQGREPAGFYDYSSGRLLLEGIRLADAGDVYIGPGESPQALFDRITSVVGEVRRSGAIPVVLGGDHSISFAAIRAFAPKRFGIIHLDAHTDLGAMPGDVLHHGSFMTHVLERLDCVEHVYQIGLRGLTDARSYAAHPRVTAWGMETFRLRGIQALVDSIPDDRDYYLTLDIDVLDPAYAPSTGTPVPGGMNPAEVKALLRAIAGQRSLLGWDIVEVGQGHTPWDTTPLLAVECVLTVADGVVEFIRSTLARAEIKEEAR